MGKKYLIILVGFILTFALLTGCGMTRTVQRTQTSDDSSTQREEELQAEIDALQKEIDDLKGSQGSQDQQNTDPADDGQAADSGNGTQSSSGNTGSTSGVAVTLEEAQNIALERVPGASAQNISIELDEDDGWYIYEGDIVYDGMEYEFEIDANTGNILKWEEERW
ncbi:PepSY domain-containing protein [Mediterraneibacter glycyrrhizinilyticus]|jgi:uncharacterized membrane protein YkoI|uniref:PepSY domain-containing protein n=1 Tax=Candidatus Mediterraneibacter faecipullorum TaxID=2838670 RepID=A0A9D2NND8_9FIRM|nr:PepSY domain-containing protein [Mediterraneibacter glycyrrhizinilyticus]HJB47441.1 PepSY domain-containing protein [Candidatus Mediterraneibacter surreyensis]HJC34942.1 PepSY domain-containing protein [Candidatus Mediterraneibacter faecipullorum]MBM6802493.1 PepSY domain-containing protein [Mediterraneibacter glycyrrhizinilyticus]MDM8124011.1 PepSY domain-containing protein [Mediterraneibacter glycyrrhizinilyticus]MDM8210986.1 PepSY domain-containing protein [Mediterraneibacter glycyrrhizi